MILWGKIDDFCNKNKKIQNFPKISENRPISKSSRFFKSSPNFNRETALEKGRSEVSNAVSGLKFGPELKNLEGFEIPRNFGKFWIFWQKLTILAKKIQNFPKISENRPISKPSRFFKSSPNFNWETALETSDRPFSNAVSGLEFELDLKNLEGVKI